MKKLQQNEKNTIFASINENVMCTRTIRIDDALMEQAKSLFPTDEALQLWLEKQLEYALLSYCSRQKTAMPCSHTEEEMFEIVKERLQDLENGTAGLVDEEEVFSEIRERYGFEA